MACPGSYRRQVARPGISDAVIRTSVRASQPRRLLRAVCTAARSSPGAPAAYGVAGQPARFLTPPLVSVQIIFAVGTDTATPPGWRRETVEAVRVVPHARSCVHPAVGAAPAGEY